MMRWPSSPTPVSQSLDELQRRGIEHADRVGAVVDGAEWIQGYIDLHAPDAQRILDFPHAEVVILAPPTPYGMSMTPPPDPAPAQPDAPASATPKADHPWRRAWSIRRQREIAGTV